MTRLAGLLIPIVLVMGALPAGSIELLEKETSLPDAVRIGANGLERLQNTDGSWGDAVTPGAVPVYRDSAVVMQVLGQLGRGESAAFTSGIGFINGLQSSKNNDVLARKLQGLLESDESLSSLITQVQQARVDTAARLEGTLYSAAAWPFEADAAPNILDTAISYQVLLNSEASLTSNDHINIQTYIRGNQLSDGGWSFPGNTVGDVYISSLVMLAMVDASRPIAGLYDDILSLGRDFLIAGQNANGSWGSEPGQVAETALAANAIHRAAVRLGETGLRNEVSDAVEWLRSVQLIDGTFPRLVQEPPDLLADGSPYETAVALRFLNAVSSFYDEPEPTETEPPGGSKQLFADIDDNGIVDFHDMFLFSYYVGSFDAGELRGTLDFDTDGETTAYDAFEIIRHWHQSEEELD